MLVSRDGRCVGWCQYGPPAEVATIKNPKAYEKGLAELPDWRVGCLFTGSGRPPLGGAGQAPLAFLRRHVRDADCDEPSPAGARAPRRRHWAGRVREEHV